AVLLGHGHVAEQDHGDDKTEGADDHTPRHGWLLRLLPVVGVAVVVNGLAELVGLAQHAHVLGPALPDHTEGNALDVGLPILDDHVAFRLSHAVTCPVAARAVFGDFYLVLIVFQ